MTSNGSTTFATNQAFQFCLSLPKYLDTKRIRRSLSQFAMTAIPRMPTCLRMPFSKLYSTTPAAHCGSASSLLTKLSPRFRKSKGRNLPKETRQGNPEELLFQLWINEPSMACKGRCRFQNLSAQTLYFLYRCERFKVVAAELIKL